MPRSKMAAKSKAPASNKVIRTDISDGSLLGTKHVVGSVCAVTRSGELSKQLLRGLISENPLQLCEVNVRYLVAPAQWITVRAVYKK